jgi:hypothetical protein
MPSKPSLARCSNVVGENRHYLLPAVWAMYQATYAKIGTHLQSPVELLDYDLWDVCFHDDGSPAQFGLWKTTQFGVKAGLSGHDGSEQGRAAARHAIAEKFKRKGYYGEVSHRVKEIALAAGSPVVCALHAEKVLGKKVQITGAVEYERSLGPIGVVRKTLVGKPLGIPTTNARKPRCTPARRKK